jgi:hypothetical protein
MSSSKMSTPTEQLLDQLMNPSTSKSEREWAAAERIEYLETRDELLRKRMDVLEAEIGETNRKKAAYKRGNTALLSALMDMCYQYLSIDEDSDYCYHGFMSCGETALSILRTAGLAETKDQVIYKLLWDSLKNREEEEKE